MPAGAQARCPACTRPAIPNRLLSCQPHCQQVPCAWFPTEAPLPLLPHPIPNIQPWRWNPPPQQYRWHEPSRESIELAFESVLKEKFKARQKLGFRPPRTGRRTDVIGETGRPEGWGKKIRDLIDPTVTMNTIINECAVYAALAVW